MSTRFSEGMTRMTRKRSKMTRYNPAGVKALRVQMAKHPNPAFGEMIKEGRMTDSDLLDFAVGASTAYFSGALLEPVAAAAGRELERMTRQAVLLALALLGWTATFDQDGNAVVKPVLQDEDHDAQTAAVQALVDTGMSVKDAMGSFKTGPPEKGHPATAETRHMRLPELEKLSTSILH